MTDLGGYYKCKAKRARATSVVRVTTPTDVMAGWRREVPRKKATGWLDQRGNTE